MEPIAAVTCIPLPTLPPASIADSRVRGIARTSAERRKLIDGQGRIIDHLRLSVTSACNLSCLYCRPGRGSGCRPRELSDSQRLELIRFLHDEYGLKQVRLTGGEPLLHDSIVPLVAEIRRSLPALSLAMTTNGGRLKFLASDLKQAGLDRLNVSLDSTNPATYRALTGGELAPVLEGIEQAIMVGFPPPRLNAVVLAGFNDDQLPDMVSWAHHRGMEIRFLEAMPIGPAADFNRQHFVSAHRIQEVLSAHYRLSPLPRAPGETAARFRADGSSGSGTIGIIAPISESFCGQCRRMRLTADGKLFPCLLDSRFVDLASCWDSAGFQHSRADGFILDAAAGKRASGLYRQDTAMIVLGG